ncbi:MULTISPECIES: phosphate signaling complex protein PhoU [Psychrobacillus]|uniref:Phosphate-specific transport system accessory protein PhoU n=1 Tax=Psychrobacillus lasiicapitis TaxID=1636719 RepID=A0A544TAG5_9BACI|nr:MULTISPECIES: phosphate signaling complex protein PhoU [Psychrobacillus]MDI2588115.1 phosphate signaling complex protein PhoU [Psychrobacillus sp. NEAU-3TGS]TQR14348.1 phosphate signaling complex protein PhoU [Psychrobacillus lasiicapitis]GGA32120.1 phosphate transport system regulatory protein PhoU [Psychrobacillus lasiicapitis]
MVGREKFDAELRKVQDLLLELSNTAIDTLDKSMDYLLGNDIEGALTVINNDIHINHMEEEINDRVILLIAKQQPVATDLRRLMVLVKIASDMERIGDYAVNIAKETIRIGKDEHIEPIHLLDEMRVKTISMLKQILDAFIHENMEDAKKIAKQDDEVDELYGHAIRTLLNVGVKKPEQLSQVTQLSFVCRYLERSADHATNLAERLLYLLKGKHYELNN